MDPKLNLVIRRFGGFLAGWLGASIVFGLIFVPIQVAGTYVPRDLDKLIASPPAVGTQFANDCLPSKQISAEQQDSIKKVTNSDLQPCDFNRDALDVDALWGVAAAIVVAVSLVLLVLLVRPGNSIPIPIVIVVVVALGAHVFGVLAADSIKEFFTSKEVMGPIVGRGFSATWAVVTSVALTILSTRPDSSSQ